MNKLIRTTLDTVEIVGKTVVSTIPVGGAMITAVYDTVKNNCLAKRQQKWQELIEKRLANVEKTLNELGENEIFVTTLIKATELAMKTADDNKLEYLASAVKNSVEINLSEEKLMVYVSLVEKYTVSHIKILDFYNDPIKFDIVRNTTGMMGSATHFLFKVYPELDNSLFVKFYNDLYTDGLVNTESLNSMMTDSGMKAKRTTELGDGFLEFITSNN